MENSNNYEDICLNYVCSECYNNVAECTCIKGSTLPLYLVLIDRNIQEHIRILNNKGYATNFSCEGHYKGDEAYISFVINRKFDVPLPKGFIKRKTNIGGCAVYYKYNMKNKTFQEEKEYALGKLLEWCKSLPEAVSIPFEDIDWDLFH